MKFSEEQVKEIVALRENMLQQVDKHQEGIEMLEKNITVLDEFLKDSSFIKASKLKKLKIGKNLLIWLSTITKSELFTTSKPIEGFRKISYKEVDNIIT